MPIKIQSDLPVKEILEQENIFVMDDTRAMHQDIRPIQILILNLMPLKEETELQLLRSLSNTPLQIDVTFMAVASHEAKNTSRSHLNKFYISFEQVKEQKFDGMIITGAPVEQMEFEEVDYWEELTEIMEWSKSHVTSTIHLCWGAQAGLYYHYGLKKRQLSKKMFGLFWHRVLNRKIPVVDFTSAIELIMDDKGHCAGAVLMNMETGEILIAKAKVVIIATGGAGRMHYQGFPTSNHYGATADGLVLAYRVGAPLREQYTLQYHPTGAAFPEQIFGALVTEKVRSLGAKLVNVDGEVFMNPLETRDVTASTVIRECRRGKQVNTPTGGQGVWLDSPMIDLIHGEGTIEKRIPAMFRMYMNYGIDMRKVPIVIYPTLHYQNGGLEINGDGFTKEIPNLLVAGEAAGGIHGRNRLMGNSLLDVIVFGRNAGKKAAAKCKNVELGEMNLDHIYKYADELDKAGVHTDKVSPLLLPKYARHEQR